MSKFALLVSVNSHCQSRFDSCNNQGVMFAYRNTSEDCVRRMKPEQAFIQLVNAIRKHGEPVCMTTDPELWFPDVGGEGTNVRKVKKLCQACPVRSECLTFALANHEPYGIWGGLSTRERQRLQRSSSGSRSSGMSSQSNSPSSVTSSASLTASESDLATAAR